MTNVSPDGIRWETIVRARNVFPFVGWSEGRFVFWPRGASNCVFKSRSARYVRIENLGHHGTYDWSIAELRIFRCWLARRASGELRNRRNGGSLLPVSGGGRGIGSRGS